VGVNWSVLGVVNETIAFGIFEEIGQHDDRSLLPVINVARGHGGSRVRIGVDNLHTTHTHPTSRAPVLIGRLANFLESGRSDRRFGW
jgi:hypothetical protein